MYIILTILDLRQDSSDGYEEVCLFGRTEFYYLLHWLLVSGTGVRSIIAYYWYCKGIFTHLFFTSKIVVSLCFQSPAIFTPYIDNVVNFCGFGFIESMLEPHAREAAGMGSADVRNIFVILGAVYFVGMLLAGYVREEWNTFLKRIMKTSFSVVITSHIRS